MKISLVLLLALAACGDNHPGRVSDEVIAACGTAPDAPGYSVAYDTTTNTATLPADQMQAIEAWRDSVDAWVNCVYGIGVPDAGTGAP